MSKQQKETTQSIIDAINKEYGAGTVVGFNDIRSKGSPISTGSLSLDIATGIGGLAKGSVVEFRGWPSSGKSTMTLNVIANAQAQGLACLLVDGEYSFDQKYARALGVDPNKLYLIQMDADGGEKCYNAAEKLIRSGIIGVVVFDSQTSLLPKKIIAGEAGDQNIGLHARLMSSTVPRMTTVCGENNCLAIYISQFREKPGVMYGSPVVTNGGHALSFYAHMIIEFKKSAQKDADGEFYANKTEFKIVKNKLAPPLKEGEFDIIYGKGINKMKEILTMAVENDVVAVSGSWYSYGTDKLGQGADKVAQMLEDNPELAEEIKRRTLEKISSS